MLNNLDIAWLSGIIEGEGSFMIFGNKPVISVTMTDQDTMDRVGSILNRAVCFVAKKPPRKNAYQVIIAGYPASLWMKKLKPMMGTRRQEQIDKVFAQYKPRQNLKTTVSFPEEDLSLYEVNIQTGMNNLDLQWLSGVVEAEGCFTKSPNNYPAFALSMTDEDIVKRVTILLKGDKYHVRKFSNHWKTVYVTRLSGQRASYFMTIIAPYMMSRRKQKIEEILRLYIANPKGEARCGTLYMYKKGCRCDNCKRVKKDEYLAYRAKLESAENFQPKVRKIAQCGSRKKYQKGCRCTACVEKNRNDSRKYKAKKRLQAAENNN